MSILHTKLMLLVSILLPLTAFANPKACLGLFNGYQPVQVNSEMSIRQRLTSQIGKQVSLKLSDKRILSPNGLAEYLQHQTQRLSLLKEIESNWRLKDTDPIQKKLKLAFPDHTETEINQLLNLDGLKFVIRTTESFLANHIKTLEIGRAHV